MDWKEYREQPDSGLFEGIARRVRRRRWMRMGAAAGVVAVAAVLCVVLWPAGVESEDVAEPQVAQVQPNRNGDELGTKTPAAADELRNGEAVPPAASDLQVAVTTDRQVRAEASEAVVVEEQPAPVVAEAKQLPSQPQMTPVVSEPKATAEPRQATDEVAKVQTEKALETTEDDAQPTATPAKSDPAEEPPLHEDNLFWAPNIIVPSGDVDANRTFSMKFTSAVTNFQIYIYNRGGRQVFHSTDPTFVWDGTMKGTALSQGAYIWVVRFRDTTGKLHEENGSVTLIR